VTGNPATFFIPQRKITMSPAGISRILFIDAYDSFTNNIVSLLETRLHVEITVIRIDDDIVDFTTYLKAFAAVVAGPGPGDPGNPKDVGLIGKLWKLIEQDSLPVLGICLGFQSLVYHFGGKIDRLPEPRHGVVRKVRSKGESIFAGIPELETVQYHSLYASIFSICKSCDSQQWGPCQENPSLRPLAWDYGLDNLGNGLSGSLQVGLPRVLMAVEHTSKPFFGLQFHAESICSSEDARKVIDAWWDNAMAWNARHRDRDPYVNGYPTPPREATEEVRLPIEVTPEEAEPSNPLKYRRISDGSRAALQSVNQDSHRAKLPSTAFDGGHGLNGGSISRRRENIEKLEVVAKSTDVGDLTIPSICETLDLTEGEAIILDSELHQRPEVGETSIIGIVSPESLRIEYNGGRLEARQISNGTATTTKLKPYGGNIFSYLKSFMKDNEAKSTNAEIPFWGGLMGYISYEACLETVGVHELPGTTKRKSPRGADLSFVFVERSIVINHSDRKLFVQSIKPNDNDWVSKTASRLQSHTPNTTPRDKQNPSPLKPVMKLPSKSLYKSQVRACQRSIRAGDSYELCLTTQATIETGYKQPPWPLYQRLRNLNPSPFSAYLRFGNLSLLGSSPERFLRWSRPARRKPGAGSSRGKKSVTCQFRPIKGTVKRQPDSNKPPLTLAEATALLSTPKERAENLMIVDLIRHDLYGVVGSGNVTVPKLMIVEEYATLFQLVSVIEGKLTVDNTKDKEEDDDDGQTHAPGPDICHERLQNPSPESSSRSKGTKSHSKSGIGVLASSLPPGSMTGAPKLRSCQLLRALESRERGVYSGVVGYMDVGGSGDFSVVIRSAVRWDDDDDDDEHSGEGGDTWTIGAGGAVTAMSTEEGEWEEMLAKLTSTLRLFEDDEGLER